jgi:hypothetical protein
VDRLVRLTYACSALLVADLVVFLISFGTCADEDCPTWREWVNGVTYIGGIALLVLTATAAVATFLLRARRS